MSVITIPKKEYRTLLDVKLRYEYLRRILEEDIFSAPPTRKRQEVLDAFRVMGIYSQKFLNSLERGLRRSSHFRT